MPSRAARTIRKFGIAEWYGQPFTTLPGSQRAQLATVYESPSQPRPLCPFQSDVKHRVSCGKKGGICSVRIYEKTQDESITSVPGPAALHTVCPARFRAANLVFRWAAEETLGTASPLVLDEIPFLERTRLKSRQNAIAKAVGKIDNILVSPDLTRLNWCAVEMQAVYLSGSKTGKAMRQAAVLPPDAPFITCLGRPDYRSSSVKRLMPQLQIKVPTLRRWGKKTVVVVDERFFGELGEMNVEDDISNADIVWLVVGFDETQNTIQFVKRAVHYTRLEESVRGLTAGSPPSQQRFEDRIREKVSERYPTFEAS